MWIGCLSLPIKFLVTFYYLNYYTGHAMFPSIAAHMEYPEEWSKRFGVVDIVFTTLVAFYVPCGLMGYYVWGNDVLSPVLFNLDPTLYITTGVKILVSFHVLTTYPIPAV